MHCSGIQKFIGFYIRIFFRYRKLYRIIIINCLSFNFRRLILRNTLTRKNKFFYFLSDFLWIFYVFFYSIIITFKIVSEDFTSLRINIIIQNFSLININLLFTISGFSYMVKIAFPVKSIYISIIPHILYVRRVFLNSLAS